MSTLRTKFEGFLLEHFLQIHKEFYSSSEEAIEHWDSGEVKYDPKLIVAIVEKYLSQFKVTELISKEEFDTFSKEIAASGPLCPKDDYYQYIMIKFLKTLEFITEEEVEILLKDNYYISDDNSKQTIVKQGETTLEGGSLREWEVVKYVEGVEEVKGFPESIRRLSDGEVFTIGEFVTGPSKRVGEIRSFGLNFNDQVLVKTEPPVGIKGLKYINHYVEEKQIQLPSEFQIGEPIYVNLGSTEIVKGKVHSIVFFKDNTYKYNIQLELVWGDTINYMHRIYNVSSKLIKKRELEELN